MLKYGLITGLLLGAVTARSACASALLKPVSGPVQTLRPRAIEIETRIDGGWARTTVTTLYARKSRQAIEADLLYTAPAGCVVTGLAYWHGKEKVVARVTERERAEEIGEISQTSEIDPAWVQLVGKNVFRARLHSIVPGRDLRVEVQFAQPLDGEGNATVWKYPLIAETRDVTLDWLRLSVAVPNAFRARNNLGASVAQDELTLKKYNFKPKTDVRVAVPLPRAPLQAQLTSEHVIANGGEASKEGYFALTLRSDEEVAALPRIEGVETFDMLPAQRTSAGEIHLFGRYRSQGLAKVTWGKRQILVWFAPESNASNEVQGLAAPLWGAQKLESVAGDSRARARSIVLSKRFNILSKWTSYVAIPAKERVILEARLQQIDLRRRGAGWGRVWAGQIESGDSLSDKALQARARLRDLARSSLGRKYGFDEEAARRGAVKVRIAELARLVMAARMGIRPANAQTAARLSKLAGFALEDSRPYLRRAQGDLRDRQVETIAQKWTRGVVSLRGEAPATRRLKQQLDALQNRYGNSKDYEDAAYRRAAQQMAFAAFNEAVEGRENGPRATQLLDAGERFARRAGSESFQTEFYRPTLQTNLQKAGNQLVSEIEAGRVQSDAARDAQKQLQQLYRLAPGLRGNLRTRGTLQWQINAAWRGLSSETAYRLAQTRANRPDDIRALATLQNQLERFAARTEKEPEDFLKTETKRFENGEPLRSAHDFRLEVSGLADDDENAAPPTRSEPRLAVRPDQPLLSMQLPRGTRHAEAILPSGETQNLGWNPQTSRWQTRLYSPHFFRGGRLVIGLVTVDQAGRRTRTNFDLNFDAASDSADVAGNPAPKTWKLGVWSAAKTQRIAVILPWRERVALRVQPSGQFAAPVAVPPRWGEKKGLLRFLMVDEGQNLREVSLDWNGTERDEQA